MAEVTFASREAVAPVDIWQGVTRRTLAWGERTLLAEIGLPKGSVVPEHSHIHEQTGYLIRGRIAFTVEGVTHDVRTGTGWSIPGGRVHTVVALEDSVAIEVFSPVRDEYR